MSMEFPWFQMRLRNSDHRLTEGAPRRHRRARRTCFGLPQIVASVTFICVARWRCQRPTWSRSLGRCPRRLMDDAGVHRVAHCEVGRLDVPQEGVRGKVGVLGILPGYPSFSGGNAPWSIFTWMLDSGIRTKKNTETLRSTPSAIKTQG